MPDPTRRRMLAAITPTLLACALRPAGATPPPPSRSQPSQSQPSPPLPGVYALPDGRAKVAATLTDSQAGGGRPGSRILGVAMTGLADGRPVTRFETELTKQLHLIAVDAGFGTFVHEHAERPDALGRFQVPMAFPYGGRWHVYADAVPVGLGQQVMRFDLELPGDGLAGAVPSRELQSSDGRYGIRFDSLDLRAGQEAELRLQVLRDGKPAPDLTSYLGVAAHAVLISEADLSYVHVHAAPAAAADTGGIGAAMRHDTTGMAGMDMPGLGHPGGSGHGGMPGMGGAPLRPGAKLPPNLTLHVLAPEAGTYRLWLQFMGGNGVRTVPFMVRVA